MTREARHRRRLLGVTLALVSAASFGIKPVLTKIIYEDGAEPVGVLAIRFALAATLVVILTAGLQRQWPRPLVLACVVIATIGTALTVGPVQGGQTTGVLLGLSAALIYACYIVISSRVVGVGPFTTAAWVLTAGAVAMAGVALIGTVVAVTTLFMALALLGPADTSVVSTVEPVVSIAVAGLVLGERLSTVQLVGGAVVLLAVGVLAVGVLARARPVDEPVPV